MRTILNCIVLFTTFPLHYRDQIDQYSLSLEVIALKQIIFLWIQLCNTSTKNSAKKKRISTSIWNEHEPCKINIYIKNYHAMKTSSSNGYENFCIIFLFRNWMLVLYQHIMIFQLWFLLYIWAWIVSHLKVFLYFSFTKLKWKRLRWYFIVFRPNFTLLWFMLQQETRCNNRDGLLNLSFTLKISIFSEAYI